MNTTEQSDTEVLFRTYDCFDWWIDRIGNMEFLSDQMFGAGDYMSRSFAVENYRTASRYGYFGYLI
jgi:hypothetical protein